MARKKVVGGVRMLEVKKRSREGFARLHFSNFGVWFGQDTPRIQDLDVP